MLNLLNSLEYNVKQKKNIYTLWEKCQQRLGKLPLFFLAMYTKPIIIIDFFFQ